MDDKRALLDQLKIDRTEEPAEQSGLRLNVWVVGVLVALLLVGWGLALFGGGLFAADPEPVAAPTAAPTSPNTAAAQTPTPAPAAPVIDRSGEVLNASGYITARRMATVSAEITGRITEVLIEEGMAVDKGQVIARLDDELARVDLQLAEAGQRSAAAAIVSVQANLAEARRQLTRAEGLIDQNFITEAELTNRRSQVEALEADLTRLQADLNVARLQVDRAREQLEDHTVVAPFAGVIVNKAAQPGEIVSPISAGGGFTRTGIGTIVDMDSLEIEVDVNESYIGRVSDDQRVRATLDAYPDWQIPASVIAIIPTADRNKATVRVRIALLEKDPRILPDMGVKVAFLRE